jgi:indole-3-glycerol phosphate synthase
VGILDDIVADKRLELTRRRADVREAELLRRCRDLPAPRDFEAALHRGRAPVRLIAEVKRASPSRGVLATSFDPVELATTYAAHGAAAISVVTDEKYFQGSLPLLGQVRAALDIPVLRKDFTIDEYQIWESRAAGADAILLIVAILEPRRLGDLLGVAKAAGLAALVETHTAREIDVAAAAGARLLGINNRDLATFDTRIETTLELIPRVPPSALVVSESGFATAADVRRVVAAGATAVLVGEALVRATDVAAKVRELCLA